MTTYHFKRGQKHFVERKETLAGYLFFLSISFILFIFHILNIPSFFGGDFHLFLFDLGILFLLLVKRERLHFFTLFCFYLLLDFLEGSIVGISFPAFLIGFIGAKSVSNLLSSMLGFAISSVIFLIIFSSIKILGLYIFTNDFTSINLVQFLLKSICYSALFFTNFLLISQR
jgi:hypothetical protein